MRKTWDKRIFDAIGYVSVTGFALVCLIPFLLVLGSSFTSEEYILRNGYTFFPVEFSWEGYALALKEPTAIINAYMVTIFVTVVGTVISVFLCAMTGYVIQRRDFRWRGGVSFFLFFTTLFSGGLVPWYILCVQYLGFKNSIMALIIPGLISVWHILIVKGFMAGIPYEITESAKIDGAGDFRIFVSCVLPVAKPVVATIGLFTALGYWNDWFTTMLFISNEKLFTLQYFLYRLLSSVQALRSVMEKSGIVIDTMPVESMKMALTVIVTGPIIFLYPFVQKYFVKGLTIGAVKG
ncbi:MULTISPECIES: carbohydrate ABC transporter permease [unclassified Paenibacillus]|uniref:carbohydrate ABC transporter permease n=1 Tax=unclassified Paenibacillus TaxID=185978 RepID=UPI002782F977|nr:MULTISPECIES: carbohydrate ABC transporter permease [unclassified Paenibacillus]MDQ0900984.1 putative aldouronate transport system permease protein [Paenibacillus sp. V4I7]MDQ0920516.1 putative aldouronate transport system permease protein [Paenibacillus sp. V4I5]